MTARPAPDAALAISLTVNVSYHKEYPKKKDGSRKITGTIFPAGSDDLRGVGLGKTVEKKRGFG